MQISVASSINPASASRLKSIVTHLREILKNGRVTVEHDEPVMRLRSSSVIHRMRGGRSEIHATSQNWMYDEVVLHHPAGTTDWSLESSLELWDAAASELDGPHKGTVEAERSAWDLIDVTDQWPKDVDRHEGNPAVLVVFGTPWSKATAKAAIGAYSDMDFPLYVPLQSFRKLEDPERPIAARLIDDAAGDVVIVMSATEGGVETFRMDSCLVSIGLNDPPKGAGETDAIARLRIMAKTEEVRSNGTHDDTFVPEQRTGLFSKMPMHMTHRSTKEESAT